MDVGKRITELREKRKITTNKLANLSGISQSYLREIELGKKNPTVEFLSYICFGLDISLQEFFTEDNNQINPYLISALQKLDNEQQMKLCDFLNTMKK